jgi:hypothetical protein
MDDLKLYVDYLFHNYGHSSNINELKEEILSNLNAKKEDLIAGGMDEETAIRSVKESITDISNLIEENITVDKHSFIMELLQRIIIYSMIGWIILIPCSIFRTGILLSFLLFIIIITGIIYLLFRLSVGKADKSKVSYITINQQRLNKISKYIWFIWLIYICISTVKTAGIHFASNIWFHRKIVIDGPYQFALILVEFGIPFISIIFPLLIGSLAGLASKYEVADHD